MSFLRDIGEAFQRWQSQSEIAATVGHFEQHMKADADAVQSFSDSGSFRSQVDRLFGLARMDEARELEALARSVVSTCLTNRYYRPADYLSDVTDALETLTFLGPDPGGEPGLSELEGNARRAKLERVRGSWLVPAKIGSLETLVAAYAQQVGRRFSYAVFNKFERQAARLFALLAPSETLDVERRWSLALARWKEGPVRPGAFADPASAMESVVHGLEGRLSDEEARGLRVRASHLPIRLSTLVPEDRQHLIAVVLRGLESAPGAPDVAATIAVTTREPSPPKAAVAAVTADEGTGPLLLLLSCPKCGGTFGADDETVSTECEYCGSLLILAPSDRDEMYIVPDRFAGADDVLDTVIEYRRQAARSEMIGTYREQQQDPEATPPEIWLRLRLAQYEQQLRASARVRRAHRLYIPYWHITGKIIQGALGRHGTGGKVVRVRAFAVEHTVPGYDGRWNLRDRGLRLSHTRVQPLTVGQVRAAGAFLPRVGIPSDAEREIEKWRGQTLEPGFDPVVKHGQLVFRRHIAVYRPSWFVEVELEGKAAWIMADGIFRTIAGYPTADEVERLTRACISDPLQFGEESYRRVHVVASRCPDCGHEQHLDPRHQVTACPNCRLGLEPTPGGIRLVSYDHVAFDDRPADGHYLPFWRFPFELSGPSGPVRDLAALKAAVFPSGGPASWNPQGDALWIPAVGLVGTAIGDEAFRALVAWIHTRDLPVRREKIPLAVQAQPWGASLSAHEAAPLARFALMALHTSVSAAQLSAPAFTNAMAKPRLTLGTPRLTMVPLEQDGPQLVLPGTPARVPLLLLRGGPELDAQRASVHAIRRSK